jgi:hypothetical protein
MSHHTEATSGSPVFRIAAAGELGTSRVPRAFCSLDAGKEMHGGVWSIWRTRAEGAFLWGLFRLWLVVLALFLVLRGTQF